MLASQRGFCSAELVWVTFNSNRNVREGDMCFTVCHSELCVDRSLMDELTGFPENLVAMQLGALLLSRMVLLDTTAQEILLPCVLHPKQGMCM